MHLKMNETTRSVIILDEFVESRWRGLSKGHYTSLGYVYTGADTSFICRVDDLSYGSTAIVSVQCPVCEMHRQMEYRTIIKTGHTLCKGCAKITDLAGMKFGRLVVVDVDRKSIGRGAHWICMCDCGNITSVAQKSLISKRTLSCGCYHKEVVSKYIGENNPNWNQAITDEERAETRKYKEYDDWTRGVLARDSYMCQSCGRIGGTLNAHHLYSYRHFPDLRLDQNNGITVCDACHIEFHQWMGNNRVKCTSQDFYDWLNYRKNSQ
jgi:5-methylcytosine-specific restriction endonuclease McrA